ncbi:MAG: glucose-6-phosphate isomerase [Candidatus Izemoplasmataceae bacterium]
MEPLKIDLSYIQKSYLSEYDQALKEAKKAHDIVKNKTGLGNEFLGWFDLPKTLKKTDELSRIKETAKRLTKGIDVVLVIGIGGSYLGAKAMIEALKDNFDQTSTEVIFVGHHISSTYMAQLKRYLSNKTFAINVISKSGTTTEPALAFRVFKALLEEKVGKKEAAKLIVATTDKEKGALRYLADQEGYETYVIEDDIGGRYSVFTAVGLLPMACQFIDIDAMIEGAYDAFIALNNDNDLALKYAATRNLLYRSGKKIEMFIAYEPALSFVAEWWKQLFGESEGKDHVGIFPASANFTTDLHSLGQYIQEGERHLFETVIKVAKPLEDLTIDAIDEDLDGLNYLAGKKVSYVNEQALTGTLLAHSDGDVPNILLTLETIDAYHLGYLLYFYELSCAISGYMLGVNPFNQPGVEAYKINMFSLLEKPGYEAQTEAIKQRLNEK